MSSERQDLLFWGLRKDRDSVPAEARVKVIVLFDIC